MSKLLLLSKMFFLFHYFSVIKIILLPIYFDFDFNVRFLHDFKNIKLLHIILLILAFYTLSLTMSDMRCIMC